MRTRRCMTSAALLLCCVWSVRLDAMWAGIDPVHFARGCPIIVTGEIVSIDEPKKDAGDVIRPNDGWRDRRVFDVAHIKVTKVHKSELSDVKVALGGEVLARMHATRGMRVSTDVSYPVGTRGIWLTWLAGDGELYICRHPQQRQAIENELALLRAGAFRPYMNRVGGVTRAQWAADALKAEGALRAANQRDNSRAEAAGLLLDRAFPNARPDKAGFAAILQAEKKVRDLVLSKLERHAGSDAEGRATLAEFMMENDPDYVVRLRAMGYLSHRAGRRDVERAFYEKGLADDDPDVRARSCFVVWRKENADLLPKVRALLSDPSANVRIEAVKALVQARDRDAIDDITKLLSDPAVRVEAVKALGEMKDPASFQPLVEMLKCNDAVRMRAVDALASFADKRALEPVTALYRKSDPQNWDAASFADAFAAMGETKLSLESAAIAMRSEHGSARLRALKVLARIDSPDVVPLLMNHLTGEFRLAMDRRDHGASRRLKLLCLTLDLRTGQSFDDDLVKWIAWWEKVHAKYDAAKLDVDPDEAARLMKEMKAIRAAKL